MFNPNKTRNWDRTTPRDGLLLEAEYNRLYDNTIALKDGTAFDPNSINANILTDKSITQSQLGLLSVGTPEIQDLAITNGKIADSAISESKLDLLLKAKFSGLKLLGEVFNLSELRQPSVDFPAYSLAMGNGALWRTGNPNSPGNIPGNWSELVDLYRSIPL
jgi:hypothetical protein